MADSTDRFTENFSILLSSGMSVPGALEAVAEDMPSLHFREKVWKAKEQVERGEPVWKTLQAFELLPQYTISLVRLGEEGGRLRETVASAALQRQKDKLFSGKVSSAMMYPGLVLGLTLIVGISMSWFVLPRLATVFKSLNIPLPLISRILIGFGLFMQQYGVIAVPVMFTTMALTIFFFFFFKRTKWMGQWFMLHVPGIGRIMKEVEMARFTSMFGLLLDTGLPILIALDSLMEATDLAMYRKFYRHIRMGIEQGKGFRQIFSEYPGINDLMPIPIQKIIISGEESGRLKESLRNIGNLLEARSENMTKDSANILEPVLLIIVWLGVVAVAFAIILPIYSLVGNFGT